MGEDLLESTKQRFVDPEKVPTGGVIGYDIIRFYQGGKGEARESDTHTYGLWDARRYINYQVSQGRSLSGGSNMILRR